MASEELLSDNLDMRSQLSLLEAAFQADWDALWSRSYGTEPMVPWEPTLGTRARHSPDRLVAARRALVAVAAVAAVWVGVLGH